MNEEQKTSELEVMQPSAVEALERASIDVQVSTAHAYPRSLKKFQSRALDMATIDEETAESCIYVRPVGGGKFAEGASIRLAEIVAASYGNIRVAARIIEQTPRFVRCEGVAHDLETNYAGKSEVIESTLKKDGTPYDERMRIVVAKACLAKAYRDAVFKVVPKALCKQVVNAAKAIIEKTGIPLEERRKKVQAWVGTLKIDEKRVFAALGVSGWADVGVEQLTTLSGLRTSIADKDVTIDEAFPSVVESPKREGPPRSPLRGVKHLQTATEVALYDQIMALMKASDISEDQVIGFLKGKGTTQKDDLIAVSDEVIFQMIESWPTIKDEIASIQI